MPNPSPTAASAADTPEDFACRIERYLKLHTSDIDYDHCELIEIARVYRDAVRREALLEAAAICSDYPGMAEHIRALATGGSTP